MQKPAKVSDPTQPMKIKKDWKYYLGISLFIYSFLPYIATGIIFFFNIPMGQVIAIINKN